MGLRISYDDNRSPPCYACGRPVRMTWSPSPVQPLTKSKVGMISSVTSRDTPVDSQCVIYVWPSSWSNWMKMQKCRHLTVLCLLQIRLAVPAGAIGAVRGR